MYKIPVSVLVVVYSADGQFLLLERAAHPGYWQSVTGSQEAGETLVATAIRELQEETGLVTDGVGCLSDSVQAQLRPNILVDHQQSIEYEIFPEWRHRYAPGVTTNTEHYFSIRLPQTVPVKLASDEHSAYQWLDGRSAIDRCFSPSNQAAISDLLNRELVTKLGVNP